MAHRDEVADLMARLSKAEAERDIAVEALERINAEELHLGDVLDIASNALVAISKARAALNPSPTVGGMED